MGTDPDYFRNYYQQNRDEILRKDAERRRARTPEERDAKRQYFATYYAENKEQISEQTRQYRERTRDERLAKRAAKYASDPELQKRTREAVAKWQAANPDRRFAQRLKPFGITPDQYRAMLAEQGGGCAICGSSESPDNATTTKTGRRRLHVDHDHASGQVRGLLCSGCNLGLGKFGDSPERLERAAMYLWTSLRETNPD